MGKYLNSPYSNEKKTNKQKKVAEIKDFLAFFKKKKEVCKVPSKSQTWSLDVLVAVSVFIVGMIIFYYIISFTGDTSVTEKLITESELIPEALISADEETADSTVIVIGNKVDDERLSVIIDKSYDKLKNELGIRSDFCIHFEDEEGNIIDLDDNPNTTKYSIGDPDLNLTFVNETGEQVVLPCGS